MDINVLSGDSLVKPFEETGIEGKLIVCRECLVDGELEADGLEAFWAVRENYLSSSDKPDGFYKEKVRDEFVKLWNQADGNRINLWFEYELFCQVNLWFSIWMLRNTDASFTVVYPAVKSPADIWKGFAFLDSEELRKSFDEKIVLSHDDVYLAVQLWEAFQKRDFKKLAALGETKSKCFPTLKEVTDAAIAIESRPRESLQKIINEGATDFSSAFKAFCENEAVYGFGDLQVKKIFDEISD